MKLRVIHSFLITILLFIAVSCVEDSLGLDVFEKIPHDAVILPLSIGNYWKYSIIFYERDNSKIDKTEQIFTIIDKVEISNEIWYLQDQGLPEPKVITYLTNKKDGLWQKNSPHSEPLRITQYPIQKNQGFKVGSLYNSNEKKYYDIIRKAVSVNNIIQTGAGKFNTICYLDYLVEGNRIIQDTLNIIFYAPNKGMVLRERYKTLKDSDGLFLSEKWELVDYKVKIN